MALTPADAAKLFPLHFRHRAADAKLHELRIAGDRVERRPELVRHHRQKLGFRPIRRLGVCTRGLLGGEETCPLERLRALLSERARKGHITLVERARLAEAEAERPERPAIQNHW